MTEPAGVSRETTGRRIFGAGYETAIAFDEMLRTDGVHRGLVGPREVDRMWERHVLNCAVIAPAFPEGASVVDVGSGAGLPGVVLAIARPDLRLVLLEPLLRRASFLEEVVERLGLASVEVRRGRAEDLHGAPGVDVVTARAVAPMERLVRWCLPLSRPGGSLLAMKGARAEQELDEAGPVLHELGAAGWAVEEHGAGLVDPPVRLVRVVAGIRTPAGMRRPQPTRRPRGR